MNKLLPYATTWMDLEGIMPNEINQTEKDNLQIQQNSCQKSMIFVYRTRTNNYKICMETQKTPKPP